LLILSSGKLIGPVEQVSKFARPFLKPVVLTFARLFAMTSSFVCSDSMPVAAVYRVWTLMGVFLDVQSGVSP
jgi:hypothetical protein